MNLAKLSSNGQVTIPIEIRKKLKLKEGDKVLFFERSGEIIISNASSSAILKAQEAFSSAAKDFGVTDAENVQELVDAIRHDSVE